jgi:hypothetical protein
LKRKSGNIPPALEKALYSIVSLINQTPSHKSDVLLPEIYNILRKGFETIYEGTEGLKQTIESTNPEGKLL